MIKREDIDDNIVISLNKRDENWQIVEDIKNDLAAQKEDYANQHDFKMKNEIVNGDFSDGATSWENVGATNAMIENGRLALNTGTPFGPFQSFSAIAGNKYYLSLDGENDGVAKVAFAIRSGPAIVVDNFTPNLTKNITRHTNIFTPTNNGDKLQIHRGTSTDNIAYIDNILLLNLTETFGVGNEPTKEEMDTLIDLLGGWFDGEITLSQKQIAIWTLNLMRKNRNAIVSLGGTIV